jgi:3'-phosphoadenosine 5'-phosphosulfate sulfotransferase (PAPS reductase)/FAD synthetase
VSDPFKIIEPTVISFSGGRTSGYMLWRILQSNQGLPDDAIVVFANTGKEVEETLEFINDCSVNWQVPIVWLEFIADKPGFKVVNYANASRLGEPFEALITKKNYLPNTFARFCTSDLKVNLIDKYMKSIDIEEYVTFVGIRADEPRRVAKMKDNKNIKETPLATANIAVNDVLDFWDKQTFNLQTITVNGNSLLSNCDLCFLKKQTHLLSLVKDKPERANWWINMENKINARFNQAHSSYQEILFFSQNQSDMFVDEEAIACFCGD